MRAMINARAIRRRLAAMRAQIAAIEEELADAIEPEAAPSPAKSPDLAPYEQAVRKALVKPFTGPLRDLVRRVPGKAERVRLAIASLVERGAITREGEGAASVWKLVG